ncbi:hypothetical protein D9M69_684470 [compost metagenome]
MLIVGVPQIGLKCSKGSRQAMQRYRALHAVEPKADSRSVRSLAQRGQAMRSPAMRPKSLIGTAVLEACSGVRCAGGAMP